jgi:CspA family cold shock protein
MSLHDIRNLGVVKWFDTKKGYGFISSCLNNNIDIFVHFSGIEVGESEFKVLYEGEYVSYDESSTGDRVVASCVTGVCGGKLLTQNGKKVIFLSKNKKPEFRGEVKMTPDDDKPDDEGDIQNESMYPKPT